MKYLVAALMLLATPALADDPKPPAWIMAIEFKTGVVSANYASAPACQAAAKTAEAHLKGAARIHCFPVLAQ